MDPAGIPDARRTRRFLLLLAATALAARLAVAFGIPESATDYPDARQYRQVARNIVEGRGVVIDEGRRAQREPGYPSFLAAHVAIFGDVELPVRVSQSVVGTASVLLLAMLGAALGFPRAGLLAAAAAALYPFLLYYTATLLRETPYVFLLLLHLLLVARGRTDRSPLLAAAAGIAGGLAALTHAGHLPFLIWLFPFWLLLPAGAPPAEAPANAPSSMSTSFNGKIPGRAWTWYALHLIIALGVVTPWMFRNAEVAGRWTMTLRTGEALYEAFGPGATGGAHHDRIAFPEGWMSWPEAERDDRLRAMAWTAVRNDPARAVRLAGTKFLRFWNVIPNDPGHRTPLLAAVSLLTFGPVLAGALAAAWRLRRRAPGEVLFLAALPLYTTLLHMIFIGSIRYRLPVEPALILLAAVGLTFRRDTAPATAGKT